MMSNRGKARAYIAASMIGVGTLAAVGIGCAALGPCDTSDVGNPAQKYVEGTVEGGVYMSSPWTGPLLAFPGGKRYELVHGLGCTPRDVQVWVSFSESGTEGSTIAPSAGNMSEVQRIDSEKIILKNDSCTDMFVLVTASASCSQDGGTTNDAAEAGAD